MRNLLLLLTGGPGLASTGVSAFWILLELRMVELMMTAGAIGRAELQANSHHQ